MQSSKLLNKSTSSFCVTVLTCMYKVHFVHRAWVLLCILTLQKDIYFFALLALSWSIFCPSAGISRWSAAFPCSDLRIVLAMARFSERHHSALVSKTFATFVTSFVLILAGNCCIIGGMYSCLKAQRVAQNRYQAWRERHAQD